MNKELLINFVNLLTNILMLLIFVRVILSWVPGKLERLRQFTYDTTEPLLGPMRKLIPPVGGVMDLTPIIAYLLLILIQELVSRI